MQAIHIGFELKRDFTKQSVFIDDVTSIFKMRVIGAICHEFCFQIQHVKWGAYRIYIFVIVYKSPRKN